MNNPKSNLLNFSQFLKTYYTLNSALCQELNDNYLILFSFVSQFNKDIIQISEAKVKRYFNFIPPKNKKLVNHKGCNSGGPDGVAMSRTFL
jgi:hypothetical protein